MKPPKTAAGIRQAFLEFFRDQAGHEIVPSAPVVPHGDPTLLFTNAGMNQFKDVFLGTGTRPYHRAVDTQKCIRAGGKHNDLEDVGQDTWHHTFFEMLGNWSFGDYFKAEAIQWAWTFLTDVCGLEKERLHVTVFAGDENDGLGPDEECEELWTRLTDIDPSHITRWGRTDNFWEMGGTGPCGPCSEIHYDSTPDGDGAALVNLDHADVIEVWNLVFIQFNRRDDGSLVELPARHVDTGMGLERIARVVQGKRSNYDTDLWTPIFESIAELTGTRAYQGRIDDAIDIAYRVVADHTRCLAIALSDGARPGPDGRGYVLRRILRRGVRMAHQSLGADGPLLSALVPTVVESLGETFPELKAHAEEVSAIIRSEEEAFLRTLDRGLERFAEAAKAANDMDGVIDGKTAFLLHDTYGFPIDLTAQMAEEQKVGLDRDEYEKEMELARVRSRGDSGGDGLHALPPEVIATLQNQGIHATDDSSKFTSTSCQGTVVALWDGHALFESAPVEQRIAIVLDQTDFYGEQGGQVGDQGELRSDSGDGVFAVENTLRTGPFVLHVGRLVKGTMGAGTHVQTQVDRSRHHSIESCHTATHLLNHALRGVLGEGTDQRGSLVASDRLRFDYAAREAPNTEQLQAIEDAVRSDIDSNLRVDAKELELQIAEQITGVRAVFGERYPDPVRVVSIGATIADLQNDPTSQNWLNQSTEFCGGTHLPSTGGINDFIIVQEQSLAAGIRRVTALVGDAASAMRHQGENLFTHLKNMEALPESELPSAVDEASRLLSESDLGLLHRRHAEAMLNTLRDQAKSARRLAAGAAREQAVRTAQNLAETSNETLVIGEIEANDRDTLLAGMDAARGVRPEAACLLAARPPGESSVIFAARVPDTLIGKGLKAGDWVRIAAQACGGGGGGRPDAAQAGGKKPEQLPDALDAARTFAQETL